MISDNEVIYLIIIGCLVGLKLFDYILRQYVIKKLEKDIQEIEEKEKQWKKTKTKR